LSRQELKSILLKMEITYPGHSCFKIKGRVSTLITDPYDEKAGRLPRDLQADIVTVSHDHGDHNHTEKIAGIKLKIDGPGEYEVGGVSVIGVHTAHDESQGQERGGNTVYVIEMEGVRLVHLGDLGHKLTQEQLQEIGPVDVAIVPVGGFYTINAKLAAEVVKQLDPRVVIPMHYQQAGLDPKTFKDLAGVDEFLKEMAKTEVQPVPKLTITADKLPAEMQVVVLERK